jgi:cell division protein FtsX
VKTLTEIAKYIATFMVVGLAGFMTGVIFMSIAVPVVTFVYNGITHAFSTFVGV